LIFKTRSKLLSTLILQKPTPTTIFNPVKKKRQFFRVGNTLTFAASPLFHPREYIVTFAACHPQKAPLLSFLSLLSTKTFRKMCLNYCVLPEDVLNKAEQASNSLIPEKSKGRYVKSNEKIKQ
jgi:hypothetical protein